MAIKSLEGRIDKWILKLQGLKGLQTGWDGYDALPPGEMALENVAFFLDALNSFDDLEPDLLSASTVGGVGITFASAGREASVEFYDDGRVFTMLSNDQEEPQIAESRRDSFSDTLRSIRDYFHG